jgi:hypothetical protein
VSADGGGGFQIWRLVVIDSYGQPTRAGRPADGGLGGCAIQFSPQIIFLQNVTQSLCKTGSLITVARQGG